MTPGAWHVVGLALVCVGVVIWPSRWADPRSVQWRERARAGSQDCVRDGPATDVAVAALLLVVALRTGLPVPAALERVAGHVRPELTADLLRVVTEYDRVGYRLEAEQRDAWVGLPEVWQPIAASLSVADRAGVPPGPLLRSAAAAILRHESVVQESAIGRVSVRLVLPLALVLLPAFMGTTVLPLLMVMTQTHLAP